LSGGEKKRLHLLQVLMRNPNFLILDEPTNDLDIFTLQVLEEFLLDFPGCLIIVSHDRYFMDRLVEHIWVLGESGQTTIRDYPGNYTQYRLAYEEAQREAQRTAPPKPTATEAPTVKNDYSQRLSFKEKYEFEQLGPAIEALEAEKAALTSELEQSNDHERIMEISARLTDVVSELDASEMRWLELSERAE